MGYWGYPWANGSAYSYPWSGPGQIYPGPGGLQSPFAGPYPDAGQGDATTGPGQKTGGIKGFFKGIAQGAVNTIKGIFTPQGLLMLGGTAALVALTGGAILPLLGAVGIGIGGYQLVKGAAAGDTEKMGEGVFSLGLSALGFMGPKTVMVKGANGKNIAYKLAASKPSGKVGILDQVKALFGKGKYEAYSVLDDGKTIGAKLAVDQSKPLNMYQLSLEKAKSNFSGLKQWSDKRRSSVSSSTPVVQSNKTIGQLLQEVPQAKNLPVEQQLQYWQNLKSVVAKKDPAALKEVPTLRSAIRARLRESDLKNIDPNGSGSQAYTNLKNFLQGFRDDLYTQAYRPKGGTSSLNRTV
jgi:hypothetical protein